MNGYKEYIELLENKGKKLLVINPGSYESALEYQDAFKALELLDKNKTPILGGDILTVNTKNELSYAYQDWGEKYISLNWYCEKLPEEENQIYICRSLEKARLSIEKAKKIADLLNKPCYIVFVI